MTPATSLADLPRPTDGSTATPPVLQVRGLTKRWHRQAAPVLDRVELSVVPATVVRVGGGNGVGKTTLLRIAAGLIRPNEGSVALSGLDPERDRRRYQARVGFLSAGIGGLYARLSVREHLELWSRLALMHRARREPVIEQALARFALADLVDRRTDRLSMGQRQRLRLALALLHEPDLLLLDEPRNSLDAEGLELLRSVLSELRMRNGAVVWCSPTEEEHCFEFDASFVLHAGRLESA